LTIPEILDIRKPLLEHLAKDQEFHSLDDCVNALANHFQLTDEEKEKKFSDNHPRKIFRKRVTAAVSQFRIGINGVGTGTELIQDETKPGNASFCISELGLKLLEQNNPEITNKIWKEFGNYSTNEKNNFNISEYPESESTEESLEELSKMHADDIQKNLLVEIQRRCSNTGFEKLCLKLLVTMGYGNSEHIGKPGDRGVDGIIYEDKLGLKKIYLQSKKYSGKTVPYGDVAQFFGKCTHDEVPGIFITTSSFSEQTINEFKNNISIKLISGMEFVKFLYEYDIGVSMADKYEIKKINLQYFDEF
jgi:restriction system protein